MPPPSSITMTSATSFQDVGFGWGTAGGTGSSTSSGGFDLEASITFDMLSSDFNAEHGCAQPRATPGKRRHHRRSLESLEEQSEVSSGSIRIEDLATLLPLPSSQQHRPLETCQEEQQQRGASPTPPQQSCLDGQNSISLSAFASGSLRFEDLSDETLRNLDGAPSNNRGKAKKSTGGCPKSLDKEEEEEEETEATSVTSSFYETMTTNESQSLMAALDLSVSEFDLRELAEQREEEERRKEKEAKKAAIDMRAAFARKMSGILMPSALRTSQRHLVGKSTAPASRHLERTKSAPRSMRVRWADEMKDIQEKRLSI